MKKRIELTPELTETGFNAFLLNEIMDVRATQLAIMDAQALILAKLNSSNSETELTEINKKRLSYFLEINEKVLKDYCTIPDVGEKPV